MIDYDGSLMDQVRQLNEQSVYLLLVYLITVMFQLQPSTSMADEASGQRRSSRARRARVSYSPETDSEFRCIFVAKTN